MVVALVHFAPRPVSLVWRPHTILSCRHVRSWAGDVGQYTEADLVEELSPGQSEAHHSSEDDGEDDELEEVAAARLG